VRYDIYIYIYIYVIRRLKVNERQYSEAFCAKYRFSCMALAGVCSDNSFCIVDCCFLSCSILLILHTLILFIPVMKTVALRMHQRFR
jgi:hypothetical protein